MSPVDLVALLVLALALLRGIAIGMVREAFSVAALAAACLAVRFGTAPGAAWLQHNALPGLGPLGAQLLAGAAVGLAALLAVGILGRLVRSSIHGVGLGFADRLAGAAIGLAEGALVVGVALLVAIALIGRDHPVLARSRALDTFEQAEQLARGAPAERDVAAPPARRN